MQQVLVVVDMQNDFITGALGSPDAAAVVEPIRQRVEAYKAAGSPVFFTLDTHPPSEYADPPQSQEAQAIPRHCIEGEDGWRLVPALQPLAEPDRTITKPSFASLTLAALLSDACGDSPHIELCGVCTDICVVSNALLLRGEFPRSRIVVDRALCAGSSPEKHEAAFHILQSCLVEVR